MLRRRGRVEEVGLASIALLEAQISELIIQEVRLSIKVMMTSTE